MKLNEVAITRLFNQQISLSHFNSAKELVSWMGAMQAQDFPMVQWAVGLRLPGMTEEVIKEAFNEADILRTHLLRPTWHLVAAEDIYWMLELSAPQIKSSMRSRSLSLGLTESVLAKTNNIIEKASSVTEYLTRQELVVLLEENKIKNEDNRAAHVIMNAELDGIICSGKIVNNKQTYALLSKRVKQPPKISRDEALAKLASRYFQSHAPASLEDFSWWSGLGIREARKSIAFIHADLITEKINSTEFYMSNNQVSGLNDSHVHFLSAYDEFIVSYTDRSASITSENHKKAISAYGLFRPIVVINGQVKGIWKRTIKKQLVEIEINLFQPQSKKIKSRIEQAAEKYGSFLQLETDIVFKIY